MVFRTVVIRVAPAVVMTVLTDIAAVQSLIRLGWETVGAMVGITILKLVDTTSAIAVRMRANPEHMRVAQMAITASIAATIGVPDPTATILV